MSSEAFYSIDTLGLSKALALVDGNEAMLDRVLKLFLSTYRIAAEEIDKDILNASLINVSEKLHKVKGTSGSLSLDRVYKLVCEFEAVCEINDIEIAVMVNNKLETEIQDIEAFLSSDAWISLLRES